MIDVIVKVSLSHAKDLNNADRNMRISCLLLTLGLFLLLNSPSNIQAFFCENIKLRSDLISIN
jgi:hypothetical protein